MTAPSTNTLASRLAERFHAAGHELFQVGGSVRDELLGEADEDLDFATDALPEETVSLLEGVGGSVYRVGERFGTIGLALSDRRVEITTYRSRETYAPGSRKPDVQFGRTLDEDLSRRDFTINAMARDPRSGEQIDPLGGMRDLTAGIIRAVGSPEERFAEDPLRILRAVRFAARLHFDIEPRTWEALRRTAPRLSTISRERVRDEYTAILTGTDPVRGLTLLRDGGVLEYSVPDLLVLTTMPDHGPRHPLSLWDHVMRVVSGVASVSNILALRWAALLHDIGKPATRTHEPSGRPRFFHHEEVGAEMTRRILSDLRYSNEIVDAVSMLVSTHMQLHSYSPQWSDGAVRRLILRLGPRLEEAIQLARADAAGHTLGEPAYNSPKFDDLERRVRELSAAGVEQLRSPLTGNDLMARYHRPGGPWIRQVKDTLLQEVLEGRLAPEDRDAAWRLADSLVAEAG